MRNGQFFSPEQKKNGSGPKAGHYKQERRSDPTERVSAQDSSGDWVLDRESWVDLKM